MPRDDATKTKPDVVSNEKQTSTRQGVQFKEGLTREKLKMFELPLHDVPPNKTNDGEPQRKKLSSGVDFNAGDPFGSNYYEGETVEGTERNQKPTPWLTDGTVFTAEERAVIHSSIGEHADMNRIVSILTTPEKVAAFVGNSMEWIQNHSGAETYSAQQMLQTLQGVCRDQHNFATYVLNQNGIHAETLGYAAPQVYHAVTLFEENGKWGIIDYGYVRKGFNSREEAMATLKGGAFRFSTYEQLVDGHTEPGAHQKDEWTRSGKELAGFMHSDRDGLAGRQNEGTSLEATSNHVMGNTSLGGKFDISAQYWTGGNAPMLQNGVGVKLRLKDGPGHLDYSVGGMHLPKVRTSGPGFFPGETTDANYGFVSVDGKQEIVREGAFSSSVTEQLAIALGESSDKFDTGALALSHLSITSSNELKIQPNVPGLELRAGIHTNVLVEQVAGFLVSGGSIDNIPFTSFGEIGAEFKNNHVAVGGSAYFPFRTTSNLFSEQVRYQIGAAIKLGDEVTLRTLIHGALTGGLPDQVTTSVDVGTSSFSVGMKDHKQEGAKPEFKLNIKIKNPF